MAASRAAVSVLPVIECTIALELNIKLYDRFVALLDQKRSASIKNSAGAVAIDISRESGRSRAAV